jgi:hypothetical protein
MLSNSDKSSTAGGDQKLAFKISLSTLGTPGADRDYIKCARLAKIAAKIDGGKKLSFFRPQNTHIPFHD